jgi:L-rhamnose mutarotase
MRVFKGKELEYKRRHDELWPELAGLLKETGIKDYSIFLDEGTGVLFGYLITEDPARLEDLSHAPVMRRWWNYMKDIMETHDDESPVSQPLKEVFYLP